MCNNIVRLRTLMMYSIVFVCIVCGLPVDDVRRNEALQKMRKYMNESVEPCDNFNEFACGNWATYHPATNETVRTHIYHLMSTDFDRILKPLMTIDNSSDTDLDRKVKSFYQSCVKLPQAWNVYLEKLQKLPDEFGKMPAMAGDNWQEKDFDWLKIVAEIQYKYNIFTLLNAIPMADIRNHSENAIYVDHLEYPLGEKSIYLDKEHEPQRIKYKEKMARLMTNYLNIPKEMAKQTANDIFEFEVLMVRSQPDDNLGLTVKDIYQPLTMTDLQKNYMPVLNMTEFISTAFGSVPSYKYYADPKFLENFVNILPKTSKKTLANIIYFRFLKNFIMNNHKNITDQEKYCISEVKSSFSNVFENIIYRKYITNQSQRDLETMWNHIKLAFRDILDSPKLGWIQRETRKYAMEKLNAMTMEIPASKINELDTRVIPLWAVDENDFLANMINMYSIVATDQRVQLYEPPQPSTDQGSVTAFTPIYLLTLNKITIPVSFLHFDYFFSTSLPSAFNFGRLGSVLGHELIHGFGDNGRQFDKTGNTKDWWDKNSTEAFNERVKCFIDQYEQYEFGGHKLPRRMNQAENIADNGGIRLAYEAYLKWYNDTTRTSHELMRETFPGFPYSNKQLFFISYAQEWCADTHPEEKLRRVASDSHTPLELRVAASLSNMIEFSEAFKCPAGRPMNPIKKCEIF